MPESIAVESVLGRQITESIRLRNLWGEPTEGNPRVLQVDFGPDAQWPGIDVHMPGQELVYVLRGVFIDDGVAFGPGTFLRYPAGSSHSPRAGSDGTTLLVIYPDG